MQVSNFSVRWLIEISWVDEDSALVPRAEVKSGSTHFELCAPEHVWVLTATGVNNSQKLKTSGHSPTVNDVTCVDSAVVMVVRASPSSMVDGRCTSVLWSPLCSLSVSQRLYAKQARVSNADINTSHTSRVHQCSQPVVHIQVFDGTNSIKSPSKARDMLVLPDCKNTNK